MGTVLLMMASATTAIVTTLTTLRLTRWLQHRRTAVTSARDARIRSMEEELGVPTTVPQHKIVDMDPAKLEMDTNQTRLLPGDRFTLRCTWQDCDFTVETTVSEPTVLRGNEIPGGDRMLRHQADYAHWTSNITVRSWT